MSAAGSSDVSEDSSRPPRAIVLCFDGTSEKYASKNTNVVKFFGLLRKDCTDQQVTYYQTGIGTYFAPGVVSPLFAWLASLMDEAVAWYLDVHVMGGYQYLMDNYRPGDKICIFGFSRGAYTARALAGMLYKVGLLPRDNIQQINFAYKTYKRGDKKGDELAAGFKQTFSQDVKVEFVGVWDTVQSTGMLVNRELPFSDSNSIIRVFRHALSLDEHRARFRPNLYHYPTQVDGPDALADTNTVIQKIYAIKSTFQRLWKKEPSIQLLQAADSEPLAGITQRNGGTSAPALSNGEAGFSDDESSPPTDVLEVWFSGCHSDVGGGNVEDEVKVSLAQITLHWMVEQVMQSQCGILFDSDELARIGFVAPLPSPQPPVTSRGALSGSNVNGVAKAEPKQLTPNLEVYPESSDALAPLFDQLKINKMWWLLEFIPCSNAWQDANGGWHSNWSINLGRGRFIPCKKPKFHHTVKERMDYKPLNYKPNAVYDHDEVYV